MKLTWKLNDDAKLALSEPPGYRILWSRNVSGKLYYNAYFGDAPGKNIDGSFDREHCKQACQAHADKHFEQSTLAI